MAPTLLGKHMLVRDPDSGYAWTVGPWDYVNGNPNLPYPVQGGTNGPIKLNDPVTGEPIELASERLRAGDRLFVLKYLKGVYDPSRWEVVVFKPPHEEPQNYIKRLIGLPGDQIALVDGDVFYAPKGSHAKGTGAEAWAENVWKIARKPERVQREVWRKVFDSTYTPPAPTQERFAPSERFRPPWVASGSGWTGLRDSRDYRYEGSSPTVLSWDDERWPIDDYTAYNQLRVGPQPFDRVIRDRTRPIFPVSDVSTHFGIEPESGPVKVTGSLTARGMEFRAVIDDAGAKVELREAPTTESTDIAWRTLDSSNRTGLITPGRVTNVEFWHVDQALWLFVDGKLVCGGPEKGAYELTPSGRVFASTGRELIELLRLNPNITNSALADTRIYRKPSLRWRFEGGPFTLHRVGLDRDLYYQCGRMPTLGGHPDHFPTLSDDDFMMCGDNSPSSLDSRFWDAEYPWVTESINHGEPQYGLVPRELLIGRAFVVYLPSPFKRGAIPMFDFTRMRWVW
ncbi:MAG: signal peptidase I [Phycisphaeraceae bacterium]|nr:MAG: signal peptidase I [Phycisphaeraceae bacterium]